VELVATAGPNAATAALAVAVTRPNSSPTPAPFYSFYMADSTGIFPPDGPCVSIYDPDRLHCCPGETCVIGKPTELVVDACDGEGDAITADVEIIAPEGAFTGEPTHSVTWRPGEPQNLRCSRSGPCGCFGVTLDGLAPGTTYAFGVRLRDEWGATTSWEGSYWASREPFGEQDPEWLRVRMLRFTTSP
jgi:hypothetical protein